MLETSARLLRLLGLLQAKPEWSGAQLAGRLGVTVRTLRRDVQRLRDLDYPVHSVPGVAGGYRLGSGRAPGRRCRAAHRAGSRLPPSSAPAAALPGQVRF